MSEVTLFIEDTAIRALVTKGQRVEQHIYVDTFLFHPHPSGTPLTRLPPATRRC